ncbi:MAG: amidohydrolase family protein [Ramlibacter sp.]
MPRADCHLHVFEAGVGMANARYVPAYDAPLQRWREAAAPFGVLRGVLVQPSFLGTDNSRLLRELRADPERLRGIAVVAPGVTAEALADLDAAGVRGLRLNFAGTSHDLRPWAGAKVLWDRVIALGWHVEVHTDAGRLPEVLACLPTLLPVVVDHMGKPGATTSAATIATVQDRARAGRVHVKLSGPYRLGGLEPRPLARRWLAALGPEALLWGSDWPFTNHEREARYATLFEALSDWIGDGPADAALRVNADRLYWAR